MYKLAISHYSHIVRTFCIHLFHNNSLYVINGNERLLSYYESNFGHKCCMQEFQNVVIRFAIWVIG